MSRCACSTSRSSSGMCDHLSNNYRTYYGENSENDMHPNFPNYKFKKIIRFMVWFLPDAHLKMSWPFYSSEWCIFSPECKQICYHGLIKIKFETFPSGVSKGSDVRMPSNNVRLLVVLFLRLIEPLSTRFLHELKWSQNYQLWAPIFQFSSKTGRSEKDSSWGTHTFL